MSQGKRAMGLAAAVVASAAVVAWLLWPATQPATEAGVDAAGPEGTAPEGDPAGAGSAGPASPVAATATAPPALPLLDCAVAAGALLEVDGVALDAADFCAELRVGVGPQPQPMQAAWALPAAALRLRRIDALIVRRALAAEGGAVSEAEVTAALAALPAPTASGAAAAAAPFVRAQLRARLELEQLARRRGLPEVSQQAIEAEFARDPTPYAAPGAATVELWLLRLPPDAAGPAVEAGRVQAAAFAAAVAKGQPAADAGRAHGLRGLPPAELGDRDPEPALVAAAAALADGAWSAPLRSRVGWAVLRVLSRRPAVPARLADVGDQVAARLRAKALAEAQRAIVAELRARAVVRDRLRLPAAAAE